MVTFRFNDWFASENITTRRKGNIWYTKSGWRIAKAYLEIWFLVIMIEILGFVEYRESVRCTCELWGLLIYEYEVT